MLLGVERGEALLGVEGGEVSALLLDGGEGLVEGGEGGGGRGPALGLARGGGRARGGPGQAVPAQVPRHQVPGLRGVRPTWGRYHMGGHKVSRGD